MPANDAERLKRSLVPPPDQWALLTAAFAAPEDFEAAFAAWRDMIGEGRPSLASTSLLPLLAPRLEAAGASDAVADHIRQAYRLAWAKTAIITRRLPDLLAPFAAANVRPIILKGLALQAHYRENRLRAFGDLDVFVPSERIGDAIEALLGAGWKSPAFAEPRGFDPRFAHAVEWHNARGDIVDLHAHPMHHWITWRDAATLFAAGAVPLRIDAVEAVTLCREHHLLQTIVNALAAPQPHGRWIADCVALAESGPIDWDRLVRDAERLRIAPLVAEALDLLAQFLPHLPAEPRERLRAGRTDPDLFAFDRSLYDRTSKARLSGHWRTLRVGAGRSLSGAIRLLPDYARFCRARRGGLARALR